jgi:hypothetical protein
MFKFFATTAFYLCLSQALAQLGFIQHLVVDESVAINDPNNLLLADIDGDGLEDVLVGSILDDRLVWYPRLDAAGSFGQEQLITDAIESPNGLAIVDFDNDGRLDILFTSLGCDCVGWLRNLGGFGQFSPAQTIAGGFSFIEAPVAADLDGDGDEDVLVAGVFNGPLRWWENTDGQGTFESNLLTSNHYQTIKAITAANIDADNSMEVIVSLVQQNVVLRLDTEEDTILYNQQTQLINTRQDLLEFIDIDADGDLDLATGREGVTVYENINGGLVYYDRAALGQVIRTMTFGDIDANGFQDVLTVGSYGLSWELNTGGSFQMLFPLAEEIINPRALVVRDMDDDGDLDFVYASSNNAKIAWYENLDSLLVVNRQHPISQQYPNGVKTVATLDMDEDGDLDLVSGSSLDGKLAWYENQDGLGTFGNLQLISEGLPIDRISCREDLTNDGLNDLVVSISSDNIVWFENLANSDSLIRRTITLPPSSAVIETRLLYPADLDTNGTVDLLSASKGTISPSVRWYRNVADQVGTFSGPQVIDNFFPWAAVDILSADFDGDQDQDVLLADQIQLMLYPRNNLGYSSMNRVVIRSSNMIVDIAVGDVDNDEDIDILLLEEDKMVWYKNVGDLSFIEQTTIVSFLEGGRSIDVTDLDNDGDLDVILATASATSLAWLENLDGAGHFANPQTIASGIGNPRQVIATDLDGDGDQDIVTTGQTRNEIHWFENIGLLTNRIYGRLNFQLPPDTSCDPPISNENIPIKITAATDAFQLSTFTDADAKYSILTPLEGLYSVYCNNAPLTDHFLPVEHIFQFAEIGDQQEADFCFLPDSEWNDLVVNIVAPTTEARPGFDIHFDLIYGNFGTSAASGTLLFTYDSTQLLLPDSLLPPTMQQPDSLFFEFSDLQPFEQRRISIPLQIKPLPWVQIGDSLIVRAGTFITEEPDLNPNDNWQSFRQQIIGAYDPNDITIFEGSTITLPEVEEYLHYLIRFQNTGNASAINVRIENDLEAELDPSTLQLIRSSHRVQVELLEDGELSFNFPGIYLPDSTTNLSASQGYVLYRVKPSQSSTVGTVFHNEASIFFDTNPAILTNTVTTEVIEPTAAFEHQQAAIVRIFPNPAKDLLRVECKVPIKRLSLFDVYGSLLPNPKEENNRIDISRLPSGIYFLVVETDDQRRIIKKVIKSR